VASLTVSRSIYNEIKTVQCLLIDKGVLVEIVGLSRSTDILLHILNFLVEDAWVCVLTLQQRGIAH
jgi:hypothetical protein